MDSLTRREFITDAAILAAGAVLPIPGPGANQLDELDCEKLEAILYTSKQVYAAMVEALTKIGCDIHIMETHLTGKSQHWKVVADGFAETVWRHNDAARLDSEARQQYIAKLLDGGAA